MYKRLYVHVPFCIAKCRYCAFVSSPPKKNELDEYPGLLLRELQLHASTAEPFTSIYFGGGTPSLLNPRQLDRLLEGITALTGISADAEITLEANPGTVDAASLRAFRATGINRLSLGIQSFDDSFLKILGRIHTAEQVHQVFRDARAAGFTNISTDLMNSLPHQNLRHWRSELMRVLALEPEHISIYGLTVEDGTPFSHSYSAGSPELPDDDLSADMFELADELLSEAGFDHYEIASYARPGYRSRHNSGYWRRDGYLGLGVAAHSFLPEGNGIRFSNPDSLDEYRRKVMAGEPAQMNENPLTRDDALAEFLFLGLRLAEGIRLADFERKFGQELESLHGAAVRELVRLGLLEQTGSVLALTRRGMLLSNQVFSRLL